MRRVLRGIERALVFFGVLLTIPGIVLINIGESLAIKDDE